VRVSPPEAVAYPLELTPAFTLPQVRYGLSVRLLEVYCTPGIDSICRQVQRQLLRNESARFYQHRTRKCLPPRKSSTTRRAGGLRIPP
jgi:hypothetical protein